MMAREDRHRFVGHVPSIARSKWTRDNSSSSTKSMEGGAAEGWVIVVPVDERVSEAPCRTGLAQPLFKGFYA
jgi:hypothetical protein